MQAKILRTLQEKTVTPIGGRSEPVEARVIAATHRDLSVAVRDGAFRQDLFYRLNVVPIVLPPLRERLADIVPLAEHFLGFASDEPKRLSAEAAACLLSYPWPGNVRELKNAMERVQVLVRGSTVIPADLGFLRAETAPGEAPGLVPSGDLPSAVARLEAAMIRRALEDCRGNRTEAARRLNIHRQLLYAKMRRYGLADGDPSASTTEDVSDADGGAEDDI